MNAETVQHRNEPLTVTIVGLGLLAALALSGCAVDGGNVVASKTPQATTTLVVEVTPPASPSGLPADEPLTAPTAWDLCVEAAIGTEGFEIADWTPSDYDSDVVQARTDGGFDVTVYFAPTSGEGYGAGSHCTASGTLNSPVISAGGLFGLG